MSDNSSYATERLEPGFMASHVHRDRNRWLGFLLIGVGVALLGRNMLRPTSFHQHLALPQDNVQQVRLQISTDNGTVSLREEQDPQLLFSGEVQSSGSPFINMDTSGTKRAIELRGGGGGFLRSGTTSWDLQLHPGPHYDIDVQTRNGSDHFNLEHVSVDNLQIRSGNGPLEVTLPRSGSVHGSIEAGNGSVHLAMPGGRPVRLHILHGNGSVSPGPLMLTSSSSQHDLLYESQNYAAAAPSDRLDLDLTLGNGPISVTE